MGEAGIVFKMAARNVLAYRKRSLLTGSVVFAGALAMSLADAFMNGFGDRLVADFAVAGGHVRAAAAGYEDRRALCPLDRLIPDPGALARAAAAAVPGVAIVPSIRAACVIQRGEESISLVAEGADARLPDGALAPAYASAALVSGRYPGPGERGLVLSAKAADKLGASLGESLVILASDAFGSFGAAELPLAGVAKGRPGAEACLVDLESMRALSGVESGAAEAALYAMGSDGRPLDPRRAEARIAAIEAAVRGQGLVATPWDAANSAIPEMLRFMDIFIYFIFAVFALVAGSGIANSVYLSVQDRARDFATLRAVAFGSGAVKAIVAIETLIVGTAAAAAGVLASSCAIAAVGPGGIRLSRAVTGIAAWMPDVLGARSDPASLLLIAAGSSLLPLMAAAYPLRVLGRLRIREALAST